DNDAGSGNSRAIGATEDAGSHRTACSGDTRFILMRVLSGYERIFRSYAHRKAEEMRMTFRLLAFAGAAVASLALASGALATQRLIVSASTIQVTEDKSDAAPLKITIYIATGFSATLGQAAGTQIGTVHADLQAL